MQKPRVFHPFLFAALPILHVYVHNLGRFAISPGEMALPLFISLAATTSLFAILVLLIKSRQKAGLIVSLLVFVFFSFGPAYGTIRYLFFDPLYIVVLIILGTLLAILISVLAKSPRPLGQPTRLLNAIAVFLVLLNSAMAFLNTVKNSRFRVRSSVEKVESASAYAPDIYYLIVDGYARSDVLKDIYGYDNSDFIDFLSKRGFFVATQSRANYCQSILSIASSLNLAYIDQIIDNLPKTSGNRNPLIKFIMDSRVQRFLNSHGYATIAFSSGYSGTELKRADLFLDPADSLSEFHTLLLNLTPLSLPLNRTKGSSFVELHRKRILRTLDKLISLKKPNAPCFIFAHILAPHPPFVFRENGEPNAAPGYMLYSDGSHLHRHSRDRVIQYITDYRGQIRFITQKIEETIDGILRRAEKKPIIILQADHGPGAFLDWESAKTTYHKERFSILNAYLFPDGELTGLYEGITPVNSFRVVFNRFLGEHYDLLPDRSFYSSWSRPYEFQEVGPFPVEERTLSPGKGQTVEKFLREK